MMRFLLLTVSLTALAGAASAQTGAGPRALAPGVQIELNSNDPKAAPGAIDETALRHYARIGDVQRMEAEIARLKSIDPNWQSPKDLFAPPPASASVDDSPIWALVSGGKLAEARAAIAEQRRKTPSWEPSAALLRELDVSEAANGVKRASDAKRWQEVVDAATAAPAALTCARLDTMWRVAQAYGELKNAAKAFDLYKTIVTTCPKATERRDTLFKAKPYVSAEQLRDLVGLARTSQTGGEDPAIFDRALDDIDIGATLDGLGAKNANPSPDKLEKAGASVLSRQDAGGAVMLGWFYYNHKDYAAARDWFQRSTEWKASEDAAEGLVYTLNALKQPDAARAAGEPWKATSPRVVKALALVRGKGGAPLAVVPGPAPAGVVATEAAPAVAPPPVETAAPAAAPAPAKRRQVKPSPAAVTAPQPYSTPAPANALEAALAAHDWSGCLSLIEGEKQSGNYSAGLAQQKGWCLLEVNRPAEAAAAFNEAKTLLPKEQAKDRARLAETCEYGLMISRIRRDEVEAVLRELDGSPLTADHQRDIRVASLGQLALRAYEEKRYKDTLRFLDARRELAPESRGLTLMRGWSLYNSNHRGEALNVLEALDRRLSDEEVRAALTIVRGPNVITRN